jgi:hypothetical protein
MRILEGERERERKIQSERWTERRGKGGREGRRLTQRGLCCFCCLLPVRRVFAYPRHDRDPICIAPMKLLPAYAEPPPPPPPPPSAPRGTGETIVDAHVGLHGGLQRLRAEDSHGISETPGRSGVRVEGSKLEESRGYLYHRRRGRCPGYPEVWPTLFSQWSRKACEMKSEIRDCCFFGGRGGVECYLAWLIKGFFRTKGVSRGAEGLSRPHDVSETRNLRDSRCHVHDGYPLRGVSPPSFSPP